jgi:hypothetical protein
LTDAAAAVDAGHLVVVPTSRWCMPCGRADRADVAERVFRVERRPASRTIEPQANTWRAVSRSAASSDYCARKGQL